MREWIRRHVVPLLVICLFGFLGIRDLFLPVLPDTHDTEAHITRLIAFHETVQDGQFPPMWASNLFGKLGSPVLMLNYQLPYYIADAFLRLDLGYYEAYKATLVLTYVLSGVAAYLGFSQIAGRAGGLAAAALYLWSPYRFLDLFVRGALGEAVAFLFLPLIILGIHKRSLLWTVVGFSGMILSHPVVSALMTPFAFGYAFLLYHTETSLRNLKTLVLAFVLSVGIAAFNLVPTLTLTRFTKYSPSNSNPYEHYATFTQLTTPQWGYGYSTIDTSDKMSYFVGYLNITAFAGLLVLCVLQRKRRLLLGFIVFVSAFIFYLMLPNSETLWRVLRLERFIDFPWRLLLLLVFTTALSLAYLAKALPGRVRGVFVVASLLILYLANHSYAHIGGSYPEKFEVFITQPGSGDAYGEYASVYRKTREVHPFPTRAEVLSGAATLNVLENSTRRLVVETQGESPHDLRLNIMYFPWWSVSLDGVPQELGNSKCSLTDEVAGGKDYSGLIRCSIPPGRHQVAAQFATPKEQVVGDIITVSSLGILIWVLYRSSFRHTTKAATSLN